MIALVKIVIHLLFKLHVNKLLVLQDTLQNHQSVHQHIKFINYQGHLIRIHKLNNLLLNILQCLKHVNLVLVY